MKLQQINEVGYDRGTGQVVEELFIIYDLRTNKPIQSNSNNQTGFSRRYSISAGDGVSWFETRERAEDFLDRLWEGVRKTPYKEGDKYKKYGNYRFEDRTIKLTAKQATAKNKANGKRREELKALVIGTVTVKA